MPNRRRYRFRVSLHTTHEGEFLEEFRKECCDAEGKDVNEKLHSLMEIELRRKHTIREQQKLSIYGNRTTPQDVLDSERKTPATLEDIKEQIQALLDQLPEVLENTTNPQPRNRKEAEILAGKIGSVNNLFHEGSKTIKIHLVHFGREAKLTA